MVGRLLLSYSDVGALPVVVDMQLMAYVQAVAFGCAVAAIAMRELRVDVVGFVTLGLLLVVAFTTRSRLSDPSLLAFALLLIAFKDVRPSRLVAVGLMGVAGTLLVLVLLRVAPAELLGVRDGTRATLHFAGTQVMPRLAFESLACLFLVVRRRPRLLALLLGCVACSLVCVLRYGALRYAALVLLLGLCVGAYALWPAVLDVCARSRWVRWLVMGAPLLLGAVVYDLVTNYGLTFAGLNEGAFVGLVQGYGLLAPLLLAFLYVRSVMVEGEHLACFAVWAVFALYAVALSFDADALFVEANLPLLLLGAGLGAGDLGAGDPDTGDPDAGNLGAGNQEAANTEAANLEARRDG
jgi:hypothetical protein